MLEIKKRLALSSHRVKRCCCLCVVRYRAALFSCRDVVRSEFAKLSLLAWFLMMFPLLASAVCLVLKIYIWFVFAPIVVLGLAARHAREVSKR